jgi:aminoglycoside 3-N-acetyltransferase
MVNFRTIVNNLDHLNIDRSLPVIVHASLSAFGQVQGGASVLVGALLTCFDTVLMPSFTYHTMIIPESGPAGNALEYGSGHDANRMAELFRPDMPADRMMGITAETLRLHEQAQRSAHPILSFCGIHADKYLQTQSIHTPLAPIASLVEAGGWVFLMGVDHGTNTSIHHAEKVFGRRQFTRWALVPTRVLECPGFPGCSDGFENAGPLLAPITRQIQIGNAMVQALPLQPMVRIILRLLQEDANAILCDRPDCPRCNAVRESNTT